MSIRLVDLVAGLFVRGWVHACRHCGGMFIGRKDATYCSNACRQAGHRKDKE